MPAQRKPSDDEAGDTPAPSADEPAESSKAEPTVVASVPGPQAGGPADATTPARPHPVRAIAQVAAPALGTNTASRRRRLAAVAIALILVIAGAVWVVMRDSDVGGSGDRQTGDPGAQATPTQPAQTTTAPTAGATDPPTDPVTIPPPEGGNATGAPGGERPALRAGWREYTDQTGFSLYVPANWRVSREGRMVYFRGDGRVLGIDQTDEPRPDPVADWRGQAATRVGRGDFPNYNEIRIEAVPFWQKAADWEFTYNSGSRRTHVNNRGFVVSSHKAYGIWWQAADAEWASARADLELVFASFRPAPAALN